MAIIIDGRARAAIAHSRGRGHEAAIVLWVAAVPHPGPASEPEVLAIDWASRRRLQRTPGLVRWEDRDIVLNVDARIPRDAPPSRRPRHRGRRARLSRPLSLDGRSGTREERIVATRPVLVVEDDPTLARAIARNLSARSYATRSAATVADASAAVAEAYPALVLLDIDLPDGSGWEVLRGLRAAGHGDVPVIVMSALRPNPRLCDEFDAAGVLEKPFPMESLLRLVAEWTGRLDAPAPADAGAEG